LLRRSALAFVFALAAAACGGGDDNGNPNNPTPPPQGPANLVIEDIVVGTGAEASGGKLLNVNYVLYLYDPAGPNGRGALVQNAPYAFRQGTNAVIPGFEQGVMGMRVGGQRRLTIPPSLAYGASGSQSIPPNSWIVFDLQLVNVAD
jgi:FKBP-type peptidyl-prolyl cis-trans isomerase FkpA